MYSEQLTPAEKQVMIDAGWKYEELFDPISFIRSVRAGLSGQKAKSLISSLRIPRTVVAKIMKTDESNVARLFRREVLTEDQSESVMDSARLMFKAMRVFEDHDKAQEWMDTRNTVLGGHAPNEFLDTFEGRRWINNILTNIEFGEFG